MDHFSASGVKSITFKDGQWHDGEVPLFHSMTHAAWLGSVVFDGARAFDGVAPDLDRHCRRVIRSAHSFEPPVVMRPSMSTRSLSATGTPCSGPTP